MKNNNPIVKDEKPCDELKTTKALAKILDEENLSEIELDNGKFKIRVARTLSSAGAVMMQNPATFIHHNPASDPSCTTETVCKTETVCDFRSHPGLIKSPMVGVVYLAPEPSAPTFVKEGDTVKAGQTLLLVEAMKTFNPITAPKAGVIKKIIIEDSAPVEFGEPLMVIE